MVDFRVIFSVFIVNIKNTIFFQFKYSSIVIFNFHIAEIMVNWLDIMDESIIFTDYVTYYIVRGLSKDSQLWIDWIDKGIVIAQNTKHESFIESLVWTISDRINDYSEFQKYCIKFADDSKKLIEAIPKGI